MIADAALEALWKNVVQRWDDDAAHGAFLEHCRASGRLDEAAVRYRGMAGDRERAAGAEKRLKAVALLALAQLETSRTPPRAAAGRTIAMLVLLAILVAATIMTMWAYGAAG